MKVQIVTPEGLCAAENTALLLFLAALIHELTVTARSHYLSADGEKILVQTNEAVHRLSGRLRDMMASSEELTLSRAQGIVDQATLLEPGPLASLAKYLTSPPGKT